MRFSFISDYFHVSAVVKGYSVPRQHLRMNGFALFIGLFCVFASHLHDFDISFGCIAQFMFQGISSGIIAQIRAL